MGVSPATGLCTVEGLWMPRGLYGKVWGICKLQASNLCCNLSPLIHSTRRPTVAIKRNEYMNSSPSSMCSYFVVVQQRASSLKCFMMCCWRAGAVFA